MSNPTHYSKIFSGKRINHLFFENLHWRARGLGKCWPKKSPSIFWKYWLSLKILLHDTLHHPSPSMIQFPGFSDLISKVIQLDVMHLARLKKHQKTTRKPIANQLLLCLKCFLQNSVILILRSSLLIYRSLHNLVMSLCLRITVL